MYVVLDCETTGLDPERHQLWQCGAVVLDSRLREADARVWGARPYMLDHFDLDALEINGLEPAELLRLPDYRAAAVQCTAWLMLYTHGGGPSRRIKPLTVIAQNWPFDRAFLGDWLGDEVMRTCFHRHYRDTAVLAGAINDFHIARGKPAPFASLSLGALADTLGVMLVNSHNALCDARATAEVYRRLLDWECA